MKSRGNDGEGRFGRHNERHIRQAEAGERDIKFVVWESKKKKLLPPSTPRAIQNIYRRRKRERKFLPPHLYWNVPYTF